MWQSRLNVVCFFMSLSSAILWLSLSTWLWRFSRWQMVTGLIVPQGSRAR